MRFSLLLPIYAAVLAASEITEVNGKKLYPSLRTFSSKEALTESYLWTYFTRATTDISALTTAIYLEDTKTILVLADPKTRDLVSTAKQLLGFSIRSEVKLLEIDLGSELFSVGSDYFPLVTVSAEHSSGGATIEREVTQMFHIEFVPSVNRAFGLAVVTLKAVLGLTFGSDLSEKEIVTCSSNPGGRVQLQVSNRMLHFPKARTRNVKYIVKDKEFSASSWEDVKSAVADEEHMGALFYENFKLGKHRCVTDTTHFEDQEGRKWMEWSQPYEKKWDGEDKSSTDLTTGSSNSSSNCKAELINGSRNSSAYYKTELINGSRNSSAYYKTELINGSRNSSAYCKTELINGSRNSSANYKANLVAGSSNISSSRAKLTLSISSASPVFFTNGTGTLGPTSL